MYKTGITFPQVIADGMIIQRDKKIPVWGKATPNVALRIEFCGETYRTRTDKNGSWQTALNPIGAGGPYTLTVSAEDVGAVTVRDIYAGDVWYCCGQSNMEYPMARLWDNYSEEWTAPNPLIRQFKVEMSVDFAGPLPELRSGKWAAASSETLGGFSTVAWFFAKRLYEKERVPIGLIIIAEGGTPIEALMSRDALKDFPALIARGQQYADISFQNATIQACETANAAWYAAVQNGDAGLKNRWYAPEFTDAGWDTLELPGDFAEIPSLKDFCGVLWLKKQVSLSADYDGKEAKLWLGTITDADTVYINGTEVGNTTYCYPRRKYEVPAGLLHTGTNQITMRVVCNNGLGGVTPGKAFRLFQGDWRAPAVLAELAGTWKQCMGYKTTQKPNGFFLHWQPMGMFNAMTAPLARVPVRGIAWYQGESNTDTADEYDYETLFTSMIQDWRARIAQSDADKLPFVFAQLPAFGDPKDEALQRRWAMVREAQKAALKLPATAMAVTYDLGEWNDLHPVRKKEVGERLAEAALEITK
jgi:sialate O-acetylesterase